MMQKEKEWHSRAMLIDPKKTRSGIKRGVITQPSTFLH
jgi:hypothetical protein